MQAPTATSPHPAPSLAHFPVALFSTVMGTGGLALAWHKAAGVLGWPSAVGQGLTLLASLLLVIVGLLYALKWLRHPAEARAERKHPVKMNFVPTLSIGILLVAGAWLPSSPAAALPLWTLGALLHLSFTLVTMSAWIHHDHFEIQHLNPAWFIPVVGNIIVPLAGVHLAPVEISWFFFSIGVVFWLVLMTIVLHRLFFNEPLPERLTPTLFILIAPPAAGFLAWVALVDQIDAFARVLYFTALFLTLLLASNALRFLRLPFAIPAWAYSFPLAAMTLAALEMGARTGSGFHHGLGLILLALLTMVVVLLALKTLGAARKGRICVPE